MDEGAAQQRAAAALERAVGEIKTSAEASRALNSLEKSAGKVRAEEVAESLPDVSSAQQMAAIEQAAEVRAEGKPASVIITAAVQAANAAPGEKTVLDKAVTQALGAAEPADVAVAARHGRRLLRHELFRRLRPLHAADAFAFVQINQLPHTRQTDRFMSGLSWVMTGGTGWLVLLLLAMIADRRRGWHSARVVVPALWLATATVEYPVKKWFRRRRPFLSVVQAIIVGRKPGSYSFPSGHSAAAFAGALLLARQYPGGARGFFGLASLVAFSRIYLGAHYPGDVLSGSLLGMGLARIYACILRQVGITPK
jgi:undecaprenyl-diphosphatase